jgi:hypothetical protein
MSGSYRRHDLIEMGDARRHLDRSVRQHGSHSHAAEAERAPARLASERTSLPTVRSGGEVKREAQE